MNKRNTPPTMYQGNGFITITPGDLPLFYVKQVSDNDDWKTISEEIQILDDLNFYPFPQNERYIIYEPNGVEPRIIDHTQFLKY